MTEMPTGKYAIIRGVPNTFDKYIKPSHFENTINVELAKEQHLRYCDVLQQVGLTLIPIDADDRFPDCCFVEDPAFVIGDKAIISNMGLKSRIGEEAEVENTLSKFKMVYRINPPGTIEGGDILRIEERIYIGLSERTDRFATQQVYSLISDCGYQIVPIKIQHILHLKSACTYLGNDSIVMSPGHFDEEIFSEYNKILIPKREAH